MKVQRILLSTPDFPPKLGGLSTLSKNLEQSLKSLGFEVEILQWDSPSDLIKKSNKVSEADFYVHVHFLGGLLCGFPVSKSVNFCHGSEILFTSPNPLKKLVKRLGKGQSLEYFEKSLANIFVSDFTKNKLFELGLNVNYSRDFTLNCCISAEGVEELDSKDYEGADTIKLCSIARDVPHKNFDGVLKFSHTLSEISSKKIELYITSDRFKSTGKVEVINIKEASDQKVAEVYKTCHFNLLLSLDHSGKGFYEGFGLTSLEAAHKGTPSVVSNTGGLPENIHHDYNGFVLSDLSEKAVSDFYESSKRNYERWRTDGLNHSLHSHDLALYRKFFSKLIEGAGFE